MSAETPTTDAPDQPPVLDAREDGEANRHRRAIFDLSVDVVVSVGRASPRISELLEFRKDTLVELDAKVDDPVEIIVGKRVVARGQLEEMEGEDGQLGVRLTEIVNVEGPFGG